MGVALFVGVRMYLRMYLRMCLCLCLWMHIGGQLRMALVVGRTRIRRHGPFLALQKIQVVVQLERLVGQDEVGLLDLLKPVLVDLFAAQGGFLLEQVRFGLVVSGRDQGLLKIGHVENFVQVLHQCGGRGLGAGDKENRGVNG